MTTPVELRPVAGALDPSMATMPQNGSYGSHSYRHWLMSEVPRKYCKAAKEICSAFVCGVPYAPLSCRAVTANYIASFGVLHAGLGVGGFATFLLVNLPKEAPGFPGAVCVFLDVVALGGVVTGARMLYRTCTAPRLEDEQPLLS